jgi:hypothetical protein
MQFFRLPSDRRAAAGAVSPFVNKRKRASEAAELAGEAVAFNQSRSQSDAVPLTAFLTKENHGYCIRGMKDLLYAALLQAVMSCSAAEAAAGRCQAV